VIPKIPKRINVKRDILLSYGQNAEFRVERWFLPLDAKPESVTRIAFVWQHGDEPEQVALLAPKAAGDVVDALVEYIAAEEEWTAE